MLHLDDFYKYMKKISKCFVSSGLHLVQEPELAERLVSIKRQAN